MTVIESRRPLYERPALGLAEATLARNGTAVPAKPGKSHAEITEGHEDWRDSQITTTTCACGEFSFTGPARDARAAFGEHLATAHPERVGKGRGRTRRGWAKANGAELEAAMPLVAQRAAAAAASEQRKEQEMDEPTPPPEARTFPCKVDGCTNTTTLNRGRWAYTCPEHRVATDRPAKAKPRAKPRAKPVATSSNGHAGSAIELARAIVLTSEEITNLEAELINKYARLGELGLELAQIGTKQPA